MPVLINKETGQAESVDNPTSDYAAPLYSPEGEPYQADFNEVPSLLKEGYTQPTDAESQQALHNAYQSGMMQAPNAALEAAASTATLGLSTQAEVASGLVDPADIRARAEMHPIAHAIGQLGGLFGTPGGAAIEGAGKAAEAYLAPKLADTFVGRVGTQAAKAGIENMVFQGQDEASKMFMGDPNQSMETAAADVALTGLLGTVVGGGIGSVSEGWKLRGAPKLAESLNGISKHASGMSEDMMSASKVDIPDDLKGVLRGNPAANNALMGLQDSGGYIAGNVKEKLADLKTSMNESLASALGKTPEEAANSSDYEIGKQAQKQLMDKIKENTDPLADRFERLSDKFGDAPLTATHQADMTQKLTDIMTNEGYNKITGSKGGEIVNRVLKDLPKQETAEDLRKYASTLTNENRFPSEGYHAADLVSDVLNGGRDAAVESAIGSKAPELMGEFKSTQTAYGQFKQFSSDLNSRLKAGIPKNGAGPATVLSKIRDMAPEDILKRLSPKGDVQMQQMLEQKFPEVAETVRQSELNKIVNSSSDNEGSINSKKLFNNLGKLEPEMKAFLFKPEIQQQLQALEQMNNIIPKKPQGTSSGLWANLKKVPPSAVGMAAAVLRHIEPSSYIMGHLAGLVGREGPNAMRLATLKFLSSSDPISATGFKAAAQTAGAVLRGESKLNSSVKSIFSSGSKVIQLPSERMRNLLDSHLQKVASNQDDMTNVGGAVENYLPDHGAALGAIAARNTQYLSTLMPKPASTGMLSKPEEPNQVAKANYNRALDIAQSPLIITKAIRDGTLTPEDMTHFQTMYPALYQRMVQKVTNELVDQKTKESSIPYETQMSLSHFLGQPLDSTMSPQSIMSTQMAQQPRQPANAQPNGRSRVSSKLQKLPASDATTNQSRQMQRAEQK